MLQITTLIDRFSSIEEPLLPPILSSVYGGNFRLPKAAAGEVHVVANFVTTLDGIASFQVPGRSGGGDISGFNDADRFIMGLLRSTTDAVLFGSGSLHGDPGQVRTAECIYPALRAEFRSLRQSGLHKALHPLTVVLTGTGRIDLAEPTFHTPDLPTLIITTETGLQHLQRDHGRALAVTQVRTAGDDEHRVLPEQALKILHDEFGVKQLLHEGGPTLFGEFLASDLIDELFLTMAPQIAGRGDRPRRPGIVDHVSFSPNEAPWFDLISARMARNHLYLRYRKTSLSSADRPDRLNAPTATAAPQ